MILDSTVRWISWAHMENDIFNPSVFRPGTKPEDAVQRIAQDINGLDWVLSRFEIRLAPSADGSPG